MFTIFLESANFERLATIAKHGNVYLMRDEAAFPLLGDLADCSGPRGTYLFLQAELDRFIGRQGHFRARLVTSGAPG